MEDLDVVAVLTSHDQQVSCAKYSVGTHGAEVVSDAYYDVKLYHRSYGHLVSRQNGTETFGVVRPNTLGLSPANVHAAYDFSGKLSMNSLTLHQNLFEQVIASDIGFQSLGALEPLFGWTNPGLARLIERHFEVMLRQKGEVNVETDALTLQIAYELFRHFTSRKQVLRARNVSDKELKNVIEFIEANLETDIDLSAMAEVIGLDVFRFSKGFKAATGTSPHQFLISRRLDRARQLILTTKMPLSEIAYACGFASQSHMTSTFSRQLGETPGGLRKKAGLAT
ncbi:MAG: AraC family transcriptional regulator [Pseudomonadota bacterium]